MCVCVCVLANLLRMLASYVRLVKLFCVSIKKKTEQNGTERKRKARKLENKLGKLVNAPGHESGI